MIYSPQHIKCASTFCATMTVFDNGTRRIWKYSKAPYHFETMLDIPTEILPNTTYLGSGEDLACAEKGDYCLIKGWNGLSKNGTDGKEQWIGSVGAFTISNGTLKPVRLGPMFKKVYAFAFKKKNFENSMYYFGHQLACLPSGSKCFAEIIPKTVIKKVLGKNSWYQAVYDRKTVGVLPRLPSGA